MHGLTRHEHGHPNDYGLTLRYIPPLRKEDWIAALRTSLEEALMLKRKLVARGVRVRVNRLLGPAQKMCDLLTRRECQR